MNGTTIVTTAGEVVSARRRGYILTAGVLLAMMAGGTLPIPLYVLYEGQMGFGPLGVTVVFIAYVAGTLFALLALGDLSDHIGRRKVLAITVGCAAASTALFLAASGIGLLIAARVASGLAAGFVTGTASAALAELEPRGDGRAAAVAASGSNMVGLGLGPLIAGIFAEYVALPTRSVFWVYLGVCALVVAAIAIIPETVRNPDNVISVRPRLGVPPGMRAVPLRVNEVAGVAGFVVAGMHVDVLISGNAPGSDNRQGTVTKTLLQDVEVLSAGQDFKKDPEGKPVVVQVITVLATPEQAETLSLASAQTTVQLALRNPMDKTIAKTTGTSVGRLFNGGLALPSVAEERPVRPAPPKPPAPKVAPKEPAFVMEIISGTSKKENKFETAGEGK